MSNPHPTAYLRNTSELWKMVKNMLKPSSREPLSFKKFLTRRPQEIATLKFEMARWI